MRYVVRAATAAVAPPGVVLALALALLVLAASPASADPAGPTNYDSRITGIEPADAGVEVEVLGGDAYVQLVVPPGTTASVPGYEDGEQYLRFLPDGTVERNEASPTRWINDERYGALPPPETSADAPPRWEVVATGGTYAWHDHRVHWMTPELPDQVDPGADERQLVLTWELPLLVDEQPVTVHGELAYLPSPSPVPPVAVLLLVHAAGVALVWRRPAAVAGVAGAGAAAALAVGVASVTGLPPGADSEPALLILPVVTLVLLGLAVVIRRRPGIAPHVVAGAAGVPLVVWGVLLARSLTAAIVPTALPSGVARLLVAAVLGAGAAAVVSAARAVLAAPDLEPG